jgi:hypothetical protein
MHRKIQYPSFVTRSISAIRHPKKDFPQEKVKKGAFLGKSATVSGPNHIAAAMAACLQVLLFLLLAVV